MRLLLTGQVLHPRPGMTRAMRAQARLEVSDGRPRAAARLRRRHAGCKTYAMLGEARHRAGRGTGVVTGYVGTHGRALTAALLEGLEVIPP